MEHLSFDSLVTIKTAVENLAEEYKNMAESLTDCGHPELASLWSGERDNALNLADFFDRAMDALLESETSSVTITAKLNF